jgi:hypothetical protein
MGLTTAAFTAAGIMLASFMPGQAAAQPKIYAYHGANYCPAGFQPITISGVICCGVPNQHMSYQQAMAHPMPKKRHHVKKHVHRAKSARVQCEPGSKGCSR